MLTIPVLLVLLWLVTSTKEGQMRATSHDPHAAAMMGINVNRTISFNVRARGRASRAPAPALPALHVDPL